jgi:hypothetical protein
MPIESLRVGKEFAGVFLGLSVLATETTETTETTEMVFLYYGTAGQIV